MKIRKNQAALKCAISTAFETVCVWRAAFKEAVFLLSVRLQNVVFVFILRVIGISFSGDGRLGLARARGAFGRIRAL